MVRLADRQRLRALGHVGHAQALECLRSGVQGASGLLGVDVVQHGPGQQVAGRGVEGTIEALPELLRLAQ